MSGNACILLGKLERESKQPNCAQAYLVRACKVFHDIHSERANEAHCNEAAHRTQPRRLV